MNCYSCSRKTLGLFIRSFAHIEISPVAYRSQSRISSATFSSAASRRGENPDEDSSQLPQRTHTSHNSKPSYNPHSSNKPLSYEKNAEQPNFQSPRRRYEHRDSDPDSSLSPSSDRPPPPPKERWQIEKAAIKKKLNGESWNPRKKLSPDTMEGIRHLHATHPDKFTTPILAQYFKVSPDAIRRILKSKWRPSDDEQEERLARWDKRGEKIWSNMVELGVKPPKKWREMGVGRAPPRGLPKWKSAKRNTVPVNDSTAGPSIEDLIPIVDASGARVQPPQRAPMRSRFE